MRESPEVKGVEGEYSEFSSVEEGVSAGRKVQGPVGLNSEVPYREKQKEKSKKRRNTHPGNKAGSKQFVKEPNPPESQKKTKPQHKMSEAVEVEQIIETKPRKVK